MTNPALAHRPRRSQIHPMLHIAGGIIIGVVVLVVLALVAAAGYGYLQGMFGQR